MLMATRDRVVLFVGFEGASSLDISGPLSVFSCASYFLKQRGEPGYDCHLVTMDGGPMRSDSSISFASVPARDFLDVQIDTVVVPGAISMDAAMRDPRLLSFIAEQGAEVRRLCSVCSGTFLLAEAGLLNGRRAATHWNHCDALQARYPAITVEPDAIFVRDDPIWSSAGVTAGIDLALAMVQDDHDRELAMSLARQHVVFLKRPGGQSQFSSLLEAQAAEGDAFASLHEWLLDRICDPELSVEKLAERAGMSPRNFARVYKAKTGRTPARAIELFRLEAARRLLEDSDERIDAIARRVGFADEERLRATFQRHLNVSPRQYRERFGARPLPPAQAPRRAALRSA